MKHLHNKKNVLFSFLFLVIIVTGGLMLYKEQTSRQSQTVISSKTDKIITTLEAQLTKNPMEVKTHITLSQAYLQKVRETSDSRYYEKVDSLLTKAQKIDPQYADIYATKASVAYGRHDFEKGLEEAQKAQQLNPNKPSYYGLLGDAQIELGDYDNAVANFQKMADLRPDYNSYTRVGYIRELYGDISGAKEVHLLAISAGSSFPENIAWSYVELGKLALRDNPDEASNYFQQALTVYPDYPPALEGLGKVAAAKKEYKQSLRYFQKAFSLLPIAQYAVDAGDIATEMGDTKKAAQQYFLAKLAFEKSSTSGVNTDLENALFLADHNMTLDVALQKAQAAYKNRPSIYGADVLAWSLYKNKQYEKAQQYSKEAQRLGEFDPLILFHAGMIAESINDHEEAKRLLTKALELSPSFSLLQADIARATLKTL